LQEDFDSDAADCAAKWEVAVQSLARGDASALVSIAPAAQREKFALLLAPITKAARPASRRTQQLANAVLEHERLVSEGISYNDAFKRVSLEYKLHNDQSVFTNALTGNRFDVNKEIRRRHGATNY
jgi:hypothetical protein